MILVFIYFIYSLNMCRAWVYEGMKETCAMSAGEGGLYLWKVFYSLFYVYQAEF